MPQYCSAFMHNTQSVHRDVKIVSQLDRYGFTSISFYSTPNRKFVSKGRTKERFSNNATCTNNKSEK